MTSQQLGILNALVTYAAENIPGEMTEEEHEVTRIVARWVLSNRRLGTKDFDYKIINPTLFPSVETALNAWAEHGWRVVGTTPGSIMGRTSPKVLYGVILERPVGVSHPDD